MESFVAKTEGEVTINYANYYDLYAFSFWEAIYYALREGYLGLGFGVLMG